MFLIPGKVFGLIMVAGNIYRKLPTVIESFSKKVSISNSLKLIILTLFAVLKNGIIQFFYQFEPSHFRLKYIF